MSDLDSLMDDLTESHVLPTIIVGPNATGTNEVPPDVSSQVESEARFIRELHSLGGRLAPDDVERIAALIERLTRDLKIATLKARVLDRLPFCPDHRDKVAGKPCRECEIERLTARRALEPET